MTKKEKKEEKNEAHKFEYLDDKWSLFDKIKSIFHKSSSSFFRWKNKNSRHQALVVTITYKLMYILPELQLRLTKRHHFQRKATKRLKTNLIMSTNKTENFSL